MRVRFHPQAHAEMVEAAAYYESQQKDLGKRFLASLQDALNTIVINPRLYPVIYLDARRCLTKTFPFGALFRALPDPIIIVAITHLHRHPDYWRNRSLG
jgi:toxin ParE1/3/4